MPQNRCENCIYCWAQVSRNIDKNVEKSIYEKSIFLYKKN